MLSFLPSGKKVRLEATGLRNPYGLAFIPHTSTLLITDNGRDDLGAFKPPDELDAIDVSGPVKNFGFPHCYGQGGPSCHGTVPALVRFGAHASSDGIAVTSNGKTAYVAENGSSFAANPTGSDVQKITAEREGRVAARPPHVAVEGVPVARPARRGDGARRHTGRHPVHRRRRGRGTDALTVLPSGA